VTKYNPRFRKSSGAYTRDEWTSFADIGHSFGGVELCRLEGADAFVHVGWDYYMYVGVPRPCPAACRQANDLGLYVEDFASPYRGDPVLKKVRP